MGESIPKPLQSNPSSTATAAASSNSNMTSPNSSGTPQPNDNEPSKSSESKPPIHETEENPAVNSEKVSEDSIDEANENEEEGECGFCLFMKAGGCKDTFTDWEKCVDEGEKKKEDIVEKCFQATAALKKCMEAHSDYYAPLLQAEKAAEEEAAKQLEQEKDSLNEGGDELGKKETEQTLNPSEKKETS